MCAHRGQPSGDISLFHYVGSGDQMEVVRLGSKHFQPLDYLLQQLEGQFERNTMDSGVGQTT